MKKILSAAAAAAMVLSLAACGGQPAESAPESQGSDLQKMTFVLDWTPNTNHTGLYVAAANGYFADHGLDVEIIQPAEDSAPMMVASGKAQMGISCQDTMAPAIIGENALPVTAVAALLQHNTSGIISLKGNGMDTPKGMEGKTYATWENPVEQAMIRTIVEKDGGDFDKINMIPSTVTDTITALKTDVDAVWIFYAWDGIATQVKGIETDYLDFAKIDPVFDYYTPVIIGNNAFLEEHPDLAKAFLAAAAEGYEYAIENPEAAADILLAAAPELDADLVKASQEWISGQYKAEVERWGYIDPVRWDAFYAWLSENGLSKEPIPAGTGFTNDYLPQ